MSCLRCDAALFWHLWIGNEYSSHVHLPNFSGEMIARAVALQAAKDVLHQWTNTIWLVAFTAIVIRQVPPTYTRLRATSVQRITVPDNNMEQIGSH